MSKIRIDWLNHALEFFVVIIGILIAFQLNQYSLEKEQRQTIGNHLTQIKEETEFNKKSLQRAISYSEANLLKLDTVLGLIKRKENYPKINRLSLELVNLGGVYIRKNAYSTLVETGDIKFMKDFESKKKITNLYEYYKWIESISKVTMDVYANDYYPYLRNNFDFYGDGIQPIEIYQSKVFRNILGTIEKVSEFEIQKYRDCLNEIDKYLEANKE